MIVVMSIKDDGREKGGGGGYILEWDRPLATIKRWNLVKKHNSIIRTDYNNTVTIMGGCERDVNIKGFCSKSHWGQLGESWKVT